MKTYFFIIFISLTSFSSLYKTAQHIDYIIYGTYCGECTKHCTRMFKLEQNRLLIDTTDSYFTTYDKIERVIFNGDTASRSQFEEAKIVKTKLPMFLMFSPDRTFGKPDSYDQCGIYIQLKTAQQLKTFYIDTNTNAIPPELRDYILLIMNLCRNK